MRIELWDAFGNAIVGRASGDFTVTIDGVAVATTLRETATRGTYEFELRSTRVNVATITVAIDGMQLLDRPAVRFIAATADLDIKLSASTDAPTVGSIVVFTVEVTNLGPHAATSVEVDHQLSERVRFVSSQATHGTYDAGRGVWVVGSLAPGERAGLKVTVSVTK